MTKPIFTPEMVSDIYAKIMREGYMSKGAGDMWEPNYRDDNMANDLNTKLAKLPIITRSQFFEAVAECMKEAGLCFLGEMGPRKPLPGDIENFTEWDKLADKLGLPSEKPCEHENVETGRLGKKVIGKCLDCGVELKAKWEAV